MITPKGVEPDESEFVEVDPTGRYGRYNEILGKGASKTVYKGFDEFQGIEVAWNQVKLYDFLQSPEDLERLYCEIHLLKTLKHKNIMKFYTSWVDTANRNINFVTEMFTSGTLRQYRQKHKKVNIRAVKHWCRQILKGLLYLHSHDPPVIHRDLKCDNIFVNGNQGEVKIGDLGLAAILRKSHAAHCVGTPEFMAPEVYKEEYNELVDIYSFGMCILEMVTFEYPYSECTHPAQIYKKVISGKKPDALYKVEDPEVRQFIDKCLAVVSMRLSAKELLKDPFLQIDDCGVDLSTIECTREVYGMGPLLKQPVFQSHSSNSSLINGCSNNLDYGLETENGWAYHPYEIELNGTELFTYHDDEHSLTVDVTIEGTRREDDSIFLRIRIADKEGRIRNIYFPFDIESDTALSVATEMVAELDIADQDVTKIADMIDGKITSLVPEWNPGPGVEEKPEFCNNCVSSCILNGPLIDYHSLNNADNKNAQAQCTLHGCGAMHGRFEEVTYQTEHCVVEGAPTLSSQSDGIEHADIWVHREGPDLSSRRAQIAHSDEEHRHFDRLTYPENDIVIDKNVINMSIPAIPSPEYTLSDDYENEITQELRWLKAKYQMELRELKNRRLGGKSKTSSVSPSPDNRKRSTVPCTSDPSPVQGENDALVFKSFPSGNHFAAYLPENFLSSDSPKNERSNGSISPEQQIFTARSFYDGALLSNSLHRTTSLPVDAVDF